MAKARRHHAAAIKVATPANISVAPLTTLEAGDAVPPFVLKNHLDKKAEMQHYGGKRVMLTFLPSGHENYFGAFVETIARSKDVLDRLQFTRIIVMPETPAKLGELHKKYNVKDHLWSDVDRQVAKIFGVVGERADSPVSFLLNENSRILVSVIGGEPVPHLTHVAEFFHQIPPSKQLVFDGSLLHAPVLMVQEAIPPALVDRVLQFWKSGQKYQGGLGDTVNATVDSRVKRRTDVTIDNKELLVELDRALAKRVLPELRKIGAFELRYREPYKVGRYGSEDEGYYAQHRDTTVPELAYRRYSMSIGLSSNYEGGLLEFPEYDNCSYMLKKGCAMVFPSTLFHKINPVTRGERFVMVSFFYGEEELKARQAYFKRVGKPGNQPAPLLVERAYPGITESEGLYTNSLKRS